MFDNLKEQLERYDRGLKVNSDTKIIYEEFIRLVGKKENIEKITYLHEDYILYKINRQYICAEYLVFTNLFKEIKSIYVKDYISTELLTNLYPLITSKDGKLTDDDIINILNKLVLDLISHYVGEDYNHILSASSIQGNISNLFK